MNRTKRRPANRRGGFSMIEIMLVIGIIAVLIGVGATSFVQQINRSRLSSTVSIIESNLRQARQNAIAMRQIRRVAIDAGSLDGFSSDTASGVRTLPASIWIEGKICQEYDFGAGAYCQDRTGRLSNVIELSDRQDLPDGVMIGDVDGRTPGAHGEPGVFYIEFDARGAVRKVYFSGEEDTPANNLAPVIHLTRDGEIFSIGGETGDYFTALGNTGDNSIRWGRDDAQERYKVSTVEVVRLTGRTRVYDYAVLGPWPLDHPEESGEPGT